MSRKTPEEWEKSFFDNHYVDDNGCWVWNGRKSMFGVLSYDKPSQYYYVYKYFPPIKRYITIHRISHYLMNGRKLLPKGMVVRHTCDNPPCYNPDHLLSGTYQDNVNDAKERGRFKPIVPPKRKTACGKGHLYTPDNTYTYVGSDGLPKRHCRTCSLNYVHMKRGKIVE